MTSFFPNSNEIVTGQRELIPGSRMVIGGATGMATIKDALLAWIRGITSTGLFPEPTTLGESKVSFSDTLVGSAYELSIGTTDRWHGVQGGNIITLDGRSAPSGGWLEWTNAEYALFDAAYERASGITYYVTAMFDRYPEDAVASGGALHYKFKPHAMGVTANPASVTDNGDGTITLDVTSVTSLWGTGAGAWGSGGKRRCIVYLTTPQTAGANSRFVGDIDSDGSNLTIDISHTFGQATVSTTTSDYQVFVPGLTIFRGAAPSGAWILGTITDGAADYSTQRLSRLPQELGHDIAELAARVLHPAGRPGCYFGALDKTRDVADACSVSHGSGSVTATLTDPGSVTGVPSDWRIFTAGHMCTSFKTGGLSASFADTESTANYVVYVEAEEVEGEWQAKLAMTDETTYGSTYSDRLPLRKFNFDTSTNTVSSQLAAALEQYRLGGLPSGLESEGLGAVAQDLILYPDDGAAAPHFTTARGKMLVRASGGSGAVPTLRVYWADHSTDLDVTNDSQRALTMTTITDGVALRVHGPEGSAALTAGKRAGLELGKTSQGVGIYQLGAASDADIELQLARAQDPTDVFARVVQSGGQQADPVNSVRPITYVPDLKLLGDNGKLVTEGLDLTPGSAIIQNANSPGWNLDHTTARWKNNEKGALSDDVLYFRIRHRSVAGRSTATGSGTDSTTAKIARARLSAGFYVAGDSGDTIKAQLVEVDPTNANPFTDTGSGGGLTEIGTEVTWTEAEGAGTEKDIDVTGSTTDGAPDGRAMDPTKLYFLRVTMETVAGAASPNRELEYANVVYRLFEIGQ